MLISPRGEPLPPSHIERKLRELDDRLSLKYMNDGYGGYWAVMCRWMQNDPRRELIQTGRMPPTGDRDMLARLPEDCSLEDAHDYVQQAFRRHSSNRDDVRKMLEKLTAWNEKVTKDAIEAEVQLAEELFEANAPTLLEKEGKTVPIFRGGWMDLKDGTS